MTKWILPEFLRYLFTQGLKVVILYFPLSFAHVSYAQPLVEYTYDALGRLKQVDYNETGQSVVYNYDAAGNRTSVAFNGDGPVPISFSVDDVSVSEGADAVFTISRTGDRAASVTYTTSHGSAGPGDYASASGVLSFAAEEISKTVAVATTLDAVSEGNETFYLDLSAPTNGASIVDERGIATVSNVVITPPSFSVNNVSVSEGGILTFTVTKSGTSPLTYSINYATANNSAVLSDYTPTSGTLSFSASQTTRTISITTVEDTVHENNEIVRLNLSSASGGATISDSRGNGTIVNDDAGPTFTISNAPTVSEGGNFIYTVTKTGATAKSHNVSYATANGSAGSGDYTAASGALSFTAGQTSKTITVVTTQDAVHENNENVLVNLSNATSGATILDGQGTGTIKNDDAGPAFSVNNVSVSEGGNLTFAVTKTGATAKSHNISYATANGSAGTGDYTAASGTLSFAPDQTSRTVTVVTVEDAIHENNESVRLNLSGATSGATISDSQGIGTINNDDAGPAFSVNNVSVSEGGNLTFTVTKTGATAKSHNVSYATANGSAGANDYTTASGALSFAPGQASKTVTVATVQDADLEPAETVLLNLSSATNGATISDNRGIGTINNDDEESTFEIVRNAAGDIQAPYTASFTPGGGIYGVFYTYDPSGAPVYIFYGLAPCNVLSPILLAAGYSLTGNGCELIKE